MIISTKHIRRILIFSAACVAQIAFVDCGAQQETKQYADYSERSGFKVTNVDSVSVENLTTLAKVWGVAKYHHPVFATETLDADYELFGLLPKIAYTGKEERNAILLEWIMGLGEFKSAEERLRKEIAEKAYTSPTDWSWLEDAELLGAELSETLQNLRWADRSKPSRYARITEQGYVNFDEESAALSAANDDVGYNLLTLFRLWNMAEYYFPSVNITNKKWSEVLPEYIPTFLKITDNFKEKTAELITELSDSHSIMFNNEFYAKGFFLPVELGFVEGKLIVIDNRKFSIKGQPSVFEPGDEIISIEGHSPDYFVNLARRYIAASNECVLLREAAAIAVLPTIVLAPVPIVVKRNEKAIELYVTAIDRNELRSRHAEWLKDEPYYELLDGGTVGYIYPEKFKVSGCSAIMDMFKKSKAIIVDFRCYPSENMFSFINSFLVPNRTHLTTLTFPVEDMPSYYIESPVQGGSRNDDYYKGKIVVLVNERTQSSAEYHTMAFQATPNCVVVGSQTAGADGNVVILPLPRGVKTQFSGLGVFYPDGTNTQRVGVRIDHYVTPTIEGIRVGRDEVFEKALEIVKYR